MDVDLIARTEIDLPTMEDTAPAWVVDYENSDAELLIEYAGRACYQSWENPAGRTNAEYIANIIGHAHFSVLEHGVVTFSVRGVSRALTHELVRHRHLSFSQLSQRFVKLEDSSYVTPPALADILDVEIHDGVQSMFDQSETVREVLDEAYEAAKLAYTQIVALLERRGVPRKQAREAARAVLPNMTSTDIVVTGNHRSWREFIHKRYSMHADAEIRELAQRVLILLKAECPNIYADIDDKPSN